MLFLLRRASRFYSILALLVTNLATSMPAPPAKRSPEDAANGFSNVPKILEIQLPLKIASKDDLVAWAKYVMGLMASRINITLTTVKETAPKISTTSRSPTNIKPPQNIKNPPYRSPENMKPTGNIQAFAVGKNFENSRYAENFRHLANARNYEYAKNSGTVKPLENGRHPENIRIPLRNVNLPSPKEKLVSTTNLPVRGTTGLTLKSFGNTQTYPNFATFGISPTTIQSPLEITANINLARIKEQDFKGAFDITSPLRYDSRQLFVPQIPDFIDVKNTDLFRNINTVSPPTRAYLPVTTADSIKYPTDPFATRYFFDGVERNISSNLGVLPSDVALTTQRPSIFNEEIPLPVKSIDLTPRKNSSSTSNPTFKLPFEAVITITRENSGEVTSTGSNKDKYYVIPSRRPLDAFPPYFDTNYTLTNESDQINVVFEDGSQVTESMKGKKKEDKKKNGSSKQKKQKTKGVSPLVQIVKMFGALRRNNSSSLPTDLTPPPLKQQKFPTPSRTDVSTQRPSLTRHGRRNQTSLAQELEDDDDDDSNNASENDSSEGNGGGEVETTEGSKGSGSKENSSGESENSEDDDDDDDDEEEGGSIKAIIDLLQLVAPILEDLSDPESDTDIAEVIEAAVPILQELSEGDGETEGIDIPGVLVPVLLQFSQGPDGPRDSGAILRPLLQILAPLIGPLVGPLLVPLSHQSSKPQGQGGSNSGDLIKGLSSPLSEPTEPGKMSMFSSLVATVVSSLSKVSGKGKSDVSSLVKAIVAGSVAGSSAGSSGQQDSYGAPTSYGADNGGGGGGGGYNGGGNSYNPPGAPQDGNPLALLGSSIKDILNAIVKVVASLVNAITGLLGASSNSSSESPPAYGPPPPYGTRSSYRVPPNEPLTRTTRAPVRIRG